MVEAYRVLRDPRRRAEYDRDRSRHRSGPAMRGPAGTSQWPRGEGMGLSEEARAKMYGYDPPGKSRGATSAEAQFDPDSLNAQRAAVGVVLFSGFLFLALGRSRVLHYDDDPRTRPSKKGSVAMNSAAASNMMATSSSGEAIHSGVVAKSAQAAAAEQDELVRAFWNPFHKTWHRIPEGYEAPAAMDLTAWHKKRTDPVEWSRLFAEGKLSEIIPRGGLKERFRPAWDTYEPMLVHDPFTGKTVQVTKKLPPRAAQPTCEVQF